MSLEQELYEAIRHNKSDEEIKNLLQNQRLNLDYREPYTQGGFLHSVVLSGRMNILKIFLSRMTKEQIQAGDQQKVTPLHYAADGAQFEVCKLLLPYYQGVLDKRSDSEKTAYDRAKERFQTQSRRLNRPGAQEKMDNAKKIMDLLHTPTLYDACCNNNVEVVKKLLEEKENIEANKRNDKGYLPFQWACLHGSIDVCKLLMKSGIDVNRYLDDNKDQKNIFSLLEQAKKTAPSLLQQLKIDAFVEELKQLQILSLQNEVENLKLEKNQQLKQTTTESMATLIGKLRSGINRSAGGPGPSTPKSSFMSH